MSEQPRYFRNFKEIESRETFDPTCGITVEGLGSLIGEYHLADEDERPCQVERNGKRCNEGHKNGWLGRRQDVKEALIGIECGTKYFNANTVFVADRKRISRELNIDGYIARLQGTRGSGEYPAELQRTLGRLKAVRAAVTNLETALPESIVRRLRTMAKDRNPGVEVQFRYDDVNDNDEPVIEWVPDEIGQVAGILLWEQSNIRNAFTQLHEIRDTLNEAEISREAGPIKLKRWADKLDELGPCASAITQFESALEAFAAPANLQMLCFVVANQQEGVAAAQVALEYAGDRKAIEAGGQRHYNELSAAIRARAGGRSFRIQW